MSVVVVVVLAVMIRCLAAESPADMHVRGGHSGFIRGSEFIVSAPEDN